VSFRNLYVLEHIMYMLKQHLALFFYLAMMWVYFKITVVKNDSQEKVFVSTTAKWLLITLTDYTVIPQYIVLTLLVVTVNRTTYLATGVLRV